MILLLILGVSRPCSVAGVLLLGPEPVIFFHPKTLGCFGDVGPHYHNFDVTGNQMMLGPPGVVGTVPVMSWC